MGEFGRGVVVLDAEERVLGERVDVEPHRVARGRRRELPVDWCLATALAVHLDVQREELLREPSAKISGASTRTRSASRAHEGSEVVRMTCVIDEDIGTPCGSFSFGPHSG